jgi:AraC-like DNA-binding protein
MAANDTEFEIRAGVFHGPALLQAGSVKSFERTLTQLNLPTNAEDIIDVSSYSRGLSALTTLAADKNFFMHAGLEQPVGDLGFFGRAVVSANNLWGALNVAKDALAYYQSYSELVIRTFKGRCRIWYFGPFTSKEGAPDIQYTIGLLANVIFMAQSNTDPEMVIAYPGACPTHFNNNSAVVSVRNSHQGYIEFHDSLLRAKMSHTDNLRQEVLTRLLAEKTIAQETSTDVSALVHGLVRASLGVAPWSLIDTSGVLGIGERSLQIRLKEEGTSFREIVQAERHTKARHLLSSGTSISDTAAELGFDHRQSFSEAFTQWEGTSPSKYAKRQESGKFQVLEPTV